MNSQFLARLSVMFAGVLGLTLAAGVAQAQTIVRQDVDKGAKQSQNLQPQPASVHRGDDKDDKDEAGNSDMILLRESTRPGLSMPVSATHGR
jgi:hypothetical protein